MGAHHRKAFLTKLAKVCSFVFGGDIHSTLDCFTFPSDGWLPNRGLWIGLVSLFVLGNL
jgi:hypothetical protein